MGEPAGMTAIDTVLFDLHTTLVDQGDTEAWLTHAEVSLGRQPHPDVAARNAMVAYLDGIWEQAHQRDPHARRDRSAAAHRALFDELMSDAPYRDEPLTNALYREVSSQWRAYADAVPVLAALRELEVRTVVLSNTGIDIHDVLRREGLSDHLDAVAQSYEIGAVKPEIEAYQAALALVGAKAERTLMVGDNPGPDAGGVQLGIRTLILPRTRGPVHGLAVVLGLVTASRAAS